MSSKRKFHEENPFAGDLLRDEQILWMGQPDTRRVFTPQDFITVPFTLIWCAFIIPMVVSMLARGELIALLCPHFWVGVYLLIGRFVHDHWRKRNTFYGVTNRRLLTLKTGWGRKLEATYINTLPDLNKNVGNNGVGTITFGASPKCWERRQNTMSFDGGLPGFYLIQEANEVYALISELRDEYLEERRALAEAQVDYPKAKRYR